MFTGLVECMGLVHRIELSGPGKQLTISAPDLAAELEVGESVSVNGACLTVIGHDQETCQFEAGPETLRATNIGELKIGDRVNLERALRLGDRLGGHLVQGHVDGVGRIVERRRDGDWEIVWFSCSTELTAQMVPKGSIAVDGVSLTVVQVTSDRFSVMLIPHTLANTSLGFKGPGAAVNLETDLLAKYVAKSVRGGTVSPNTLLQAGFIAKPAGGNEE
jgi:riboflavin synthase